VVDAERVQCVLVCMPFADVLQPPLGVSVLCGALRDAGIRVKALYPSLSFAEKVPYRVYEWLGGNTYERVADFYFSKIAFGSDVDAEVAFRSMVAALRSNHRLPAAMKDGISDLQLSLIENVCKKVVADTVDVICSLEGLKVVACSATFLQLYASLAVLRQVKERRPDLTTIIGGAECEGVAAEELVRKLGFVDFACSGEGDMSLPDVVERCLDGTTSGGLPEGVTSKSVMRESGSTCVMVEQSHFGRIDHSDYLEAFAGSGLFGEFRPTMTVEFSRGCWKGERSQCTFCGFNGERMHFRHKLPRRIIDEMVGLYERGMRFFQATDTILDLHRIRPVLEEFSERCPEAVITCDVSPTLSEDQLAYLSQKGVLFLQAGIETLHPRHVRLLNKVASPAASIAFLRSANEHGVTVFWNILTSIPGDAPEEYRQMREILPLLEHLSPPHFGVIRFDRFSSYWRDPDKYGLVLTPSSSCRYLLPAQSGLDPMRLSMFFDNRNESVRTDYRDMSIQGVSEAIAHWQKSHQCSRLYFDGDEAVVDTRSLSVARRRPLSADEKAVLELLRKPCSRQEINAAIPKCDLALKTLVELRYVLPWGSQYVSLVMRMGAPIPEGRRRAVEYRMNLPGQVAKRQRVEKTWSSQ